VVSAGARHRFVSSPIVSMPRPGRRNEVHYVHRLQLLRDEWTTVGTVNERTEAMGLAAAWVVEEQGRRGPGGDTSGVGPIALRAPILHIALPAILSYPNPYIHSVTYEHTHCQRLAHQN